VSKRLLATAAVIAILIALRSYLATAGSTPQPQPPLAILQDLESFKAAFNREAAKTRAIILISASCPYCLKGASVIQNLLDRYNTEALMPFVVWQPILSTDWGRPRTTALRRLRDPRVRQFWDEDHLIAEALRQSHEQRSQLPNCCYENGIWWDLMAVYAPGTWDAKLPEPLLLEGTVEEAAPAFESILAKLPSRASADRTLQPWHPSEGTVRNY
jgi:hypothetical protein